MSPAAPAPAAFSVEGKTAIVTGAGSGINLAFAELLLSRGCNVVLADLSLRPEAQAVVGKHRASPRAVFVKTDVTSWPDIDNMFAATLKEFGDFDVVCPGAGVYEPHWSSFWHPPGSSESKDKPHIGRYALLDINLTHPIRTTQLAISHWLFPEPSADSKFGTPQQASLTNPKRVVHISSVAAQVPTFRAPLYGASKFAITGFVRCLAPLEAELGIRVNGVAPGVVRTPLWVEHPEKLCNVDEKRDAWVTPREVAESMLRCIESESLGGGTILEVGSENTREVGVYNDPGPDPDPSKGLITSNSQKGDEMVWEWIKDAKVWGQSAKSSAYEASQRP